MHKRLVDDSRFVALEEKVGEESVLAAEQVEELSQTTNEHQVCPASHLFSKKWPAAQSV